MFCTKSFPADYSNYSIMTSLKGVTVLVDDIVIHAPTEEEHHRWLTDMFCQLSQHRLTINPNTCFFSVSEVELLGYSVSAVGVHRLWSPMQAIKDIPPPAASSELASFLGMTNSYLRFLDGLFCNRGIN